MCVYFISTNVQTEINPSIQGKREFRKKRKNLQEGGCPLYDLISSVSEYHLPGGKWQARGYATCVFPVLPSCSHKHLQSHSELTQLLLPCSTSVGWGRYVCGGKVLHICSYVLSSGFSCNENRLLTLESFFCLFTVFQVRISLESHRKI